LAVPVIIFNVLIVRRNRIKNVTGTIEALLKKRFDLVPNLVNTVQGYAAHEKSLLTQIVRIRAQAVETPSSLHSSIENDASMTRLLDKLLLIVENYPNLKADSNFMHLQKTLVELEEQISAARRAYNAVVNDYNNAVQMFPSNIIASLFNFKIAEFFQIIQTQRLNTPVNFQNRS
jgi:LemA protein